MYSLCWSDKTGACCEKWTNCSGNTMKVTLACDHRAVDGAIGSAFLKTFKQLLENPVLLLGSRSI